MATPEGAVKDKVRKVLKEYGVYWFMPVQAGFGAPGLDFHCSYNGLAMFIETKAGNKKPTPRQETTIENIEKSGGKVFVINEVTGTEELEAWLHQAKLN